jgi:hypothetical protein
MALRAVLASPGYMSSWNIAIPQISLELPEILGGPATPPPPPSCLDECCPSLSYWQKLVAFGLCLLGGCGFLALSVMNIPLVILGRADKFALPFVLANVLFIVSTVFVVGLKKQAQEMFAKERFPYTAAYLGSLFLTFYLAIWVQIWWLVIPSICVQVGSMLFYGLSYIPMGTMFLSRVCGLAATCWTRVAGCMCRRCCVPS